ncbi:hypothetical protein OSR52_07590 [Galbibacter sp. CMA-7]|uniref:Uncharacterized protein n=1 Tax=Galbibacter pacificus TaxID=2996052 RepID=A0ABT6FR40_9FLAO|nr:DUF6660 family protein [Galbibacter pacificus]MDG3581798.1 hypothetical protein [Galbibacter pacificus]MDG3585728.1 hypothetical protein [Galbibacter pacificus]
MALNFMVCNDRVEPTNKTTHEMVAADSCADHADADLCSPFCQCHCCHVHIVQNTSEKYYLSTTEISSKIEFHYLQVDDDFPIDILQPPRV